MPTLPKKLSCYICEKALDLHTPADAERCREAGHEIVYGNVGLNNQMRWLHAIELTTKEPDRIGTQCCAVCYCFLPGDWGEVERPDGTKICGACALDTVHNCYENAENISIPDSYMGSNDSVDFWRCSVCHRTITVGELLKMREADANNS